ncbi:SRPBCC family protein [Arthrobacter sp. B3I9]|uniref:SRPBCC family protein n=1 Tax=Arthrobacter sp. B3I9 TaxID=3042270 RepID=UPI0027D8C3CF|nr:hypothetical protein [Arthrobacter sp. B3I9]
MENLRFSVDVDVDAPAQHVWNVMLDLDTYREWTGAFHEGSTYEGGWNVGDEIRFLGPNDVGTASGLLGTVVENRPTSSCRSAISVMSRMTSSTAKGPPSGCTRTTRSERPAG